MGQCSHTGSKSADECSVTIINSRAELLQSSSSADDAHIHSANLNNDKLRNSVPVSCTTLSISLSWTLLDPAGLQAACSCSRSITQCIRRVRDISVKAEDMINVMH